MTITTPKQTKPIPQSAVDAIKGSDRFQNITSGFAAGCINAGATRSKVTQSPKGFTMKPDQTHTPDSITISKDDYSQLVEERDAFRFEAQRAKQALNNLRAECALLRKTVQDTDRTIGNMIVESVLTKASDLGVSEKFPHMQTVHQGYQAHDAPAGVAKPKDVDTRSTRWPW